MYGPLILVKVQEARKGYREDKQGVQHIQQAICNRLCLLEAHSILCNLLLADQFCKSSSENDGKTKNEPEVCARSSIFSTT